MSVDITGADRSRWKWMKLEFSASTVAFIICRGTVLAKSSSFIYFHRDLSFLAMSIDMSQVVIALFPFLICFYHFTFSGFPLILTSYGQLTAY